MAVKLTELTNVDNRKDVRTGQLREGDVIGVKNLSPRISSDIYSGDMIIIASSDERAINLIGRAEESKEIVRICGINTDSLQYDCNGRLTGEYAAIASGPIFPELAKRYDMELGGSEL